MRIGTKSLLFGCHQFLLHPVFTLVAWVRLFGLPGPLELVAIIVHDWGYWGMPDMDGVGVHHPIRSYLLIERWIPRKYRHRLFLEIVGHSNSYSRLAGIPRSRLYWADKMGLYLHPSWFWALLAYLSGEGWEYKRDPNFPASKYVAPMPDTMESLAVFHHIASRYLKDYIEGVHFPSSLSSYSTNPITSPAASPTKRQGNLYQGES